MTLLEKTLSLFRKKPRSKITSVEVNEDLVPHFVPSLFYILELRAKEKGSALTKAEVLDIRDKSVCITLRKSEKEKLDTERGFKDINPENCWEEWCAYNRSNPTLEKVSEAAKIIFESLSPNCPLAIIVEEYQTCTYMYLVHLKGEGVQLVVCGTWIRNHQKAPADFEFEKMKQDGFPTMLPAAFCNHPEGKPSLNPKTLRCIWVEEGNGVALVENNTVLAIIPPWASNKIPSYSKDCIKENSFVWPLIDENIFLERIQRADEFWNSWNGNPWSPFQTSRIKTLCKEFGEERKYYAIDNAAWPMKGMAQFEKGDTTYLITIGVSLIPQPSVEFITDTPEKLRRIELGLAIKTDEFRKNEGVICSFLSAQTTIPWVNLTWFGHGHTIECNSVFGGKREFPFGLFLNSKFVPSLPQIKFEPFRGDDINILWLIPITEAEFKAIKETNADTFVTSSLNKERTWVFGEIA